MEPFTVERPLIGMVHMLPTPLSPMSIGRAKGPWDLDIVLDKAGEDARVLADNGADGIMVENYNDTPFYPDEVPAHTIAAMSIVVREVIRDTGLPVGVNILRNACSQALGVAAVTGAAFIRCNVLTGFAFTNEGIIEGKSQEIIRYREQLGKDVRIFADVFVKHAYSPVPLERFEDVAVDTLDRGGADALIVSGRRTGEPVSDSLIKHIVSLKEKRPATKVIAGSGIRPDNIKDLQQYFDGFIVGTYFQKFDESRKMYRIVPERVKQMRGLIARGG